MKKIEKIFTTITCLMLFVLGFFVGSIFEQNQHVDERDALIFINEIKEAKICNFKNTADWNAIKNLKVSEITDDCYRCKKKVSKAILELDERKEIMGQLVVPKAKPETK